MRSVKSIPQYVQPPTAFTGLRTEAPPSKLTCEREVKNAIFLALVGAIAVMRLGRRFCCLPRRGIRYPHPSYFGRYLHHHSIV